MKLRTPPTNRRLTDEQRRRLSRLIAAASRGGASDIQALSTYFFTSLRHVPYYAPGSWAYLIFTAGDAENDPHDLDTAIKDLKDLVACADWGDDPCHREYRPLDLAEFDDEPNGNGHHE